MSSDTLDTTNVPDFAIKELNSFKAFLLQESINWISDLIKTDPSLTNASLDVVVAKLQQSKISRRAQKLYLMERNSLVKTQKAYYYPQNLFRKKWRNVPILKSKRKL
jgi:hypothetical protein